MQAAKRGGIELALEVRDGIARVEGEARDPDATLPDGPELIVVSGAVLSTVTVIVASVWRLALSTARAVIVRGPSGTVAVFQSTV